MEKAVIVAISLILLIFLSMDRNHVTYLFIWTCIWTTTTQTAYRSVQPFLRSSRLCPTHIQTHRQTDHTTCDVDSNKKPHLHTRCVRCGPQQCELSSYYYWAMVRRITTYAISFIPDAEFIVTVLYLISFVFLAAGVLAIRLSYI